MGQFEFNWCSVHIGLRAACCSKRVLGAGGDRRCRLATREDARAAVFAEKAGATTVDPWRRQSRVRFGQRNLLQVGGFLAAHAIARLESLDVAHFAKVAHLVQLSVADSVKPLDFESSVRPHPPF